MTELKGTPVANRLTGQASAETAALRELAIVPKLAIVRVGEKESDLAYEKSIKARFAAVSAEAEVFSFPADVSQGVLETAVAALNEDPAVHGILALRPLPPPLGEDPLMEERLKRLIRPEKDVDGMGTASAARLYEGSGFGFAPCTAQAVIELLDFYEIDPTGQNAVIVGRSLVVGKPLAMLLLAKNATVTICHTKTRRLAETCRNADILIACAGAARLVGADFVRSGQLVIDVGIHLVGGTLCGDVDFDAVAPIASAVTPVPGGIGAVTTSVLLRHAVEAAQECNAAYPADMATNELPRRG